LIVPSWFETQTNTPSMAKIMRRTMMVNNLRMSRQGKNSTGLPSRQGSFSFLAARQREWVAPAEIA
jgi:hypothetical protein